MARLANYILLPLLAPFVTADFGLAGQLFQLEGDSSVNNVKLAWSSVNGASSYRVEQSTNGAFAPVAAVSGNTYDTYGLPMGKHSFRVTALNGNSQIDQSSVVALTPYTPRGSYSTFDNTQASQMRLKSSLEHNGVYYRYNYEARSDGSFGRFVEQTSTNGYDFTGDRTVLVNDVLCAPAKGRCKLERVQFLKHPSTGQFVMWAHYERVRDYRLASVAVAHTDPGAKSFTFDGAYRPNGQDSRDMAFFADGDNAWLVTSTNVNTNNNIYELTSNWTAVAKFLVQVNVGGHREAPAVTKSNGWYYLFTSRATGWLPSQPQYIAAQSMAGPWGPPANVGNIATFCSQSGGINQFPSGQFEMSSDRWANNWPTKGGVNRQLMLPISFSAAGGFASYHFYRSVMYSSDITTPGEGMYGVQAGKILSNGKNVTSDAGTNNIAFTNDGIQNDPINVFIPDRVPFIYTVDLGDSHTITQVDLTTKMIRGSETYYRYKVEGSNDNRSWTLLVDKSQNTDPGFSAAFPTSTQKWRYVRINVQSVVDNVNKKEADFARGINEVTVYGI